MGVATVASPLSCTNPRHPCQGHWRIALIYSQVHSCIVAWPPLETLSLGILGDGVGVAAVAPHCLVVSRPPFRVTGEAKLGLRAIEPSPSA